MFADVVRRIVGGCAHARRPAGAGACALAALALAAAEAGAQTTQVFSQSKVCPINNQQGEPDESGNSYCYNGDLFVGQYTTGGQWPQTVVGRSLVHFDTSSIPADALVLSATLRVLARPPARLTPAQTSTPHPVAVHHVTAWWSGHGTNWVYRRHDGIGGYPMYPWQTYGGDFESTPVSTGLVPGASTNTWATFDVRSSVQRWVRQTSPNEGLILVSTASAGGVEICGYPASPAFYWCPDPAKRPKLEVTYIRGVYHAQQWTGDPAQQDSRMLAEEWAHTGTTTARREIPDLITTRSTVACDDAPQEQCDEVRDRTLDSQIDGAPPGAADAFVRYQAPVDDDDVLEPVADLFEHDLPDFGPNRVVPDATGALSSVTESWQVLPPGHGSTYERFDSDADATFNADPYDDINGQYPDADALGIDTLRVWLDARTRLPIRQDMIVDGDTRSIRWTYENAVHQIGEYPSDFFSVADPDNPMLMKTVQFRGPEALGTISDAETRRGFAAYDLGPVTRVGGRRLCLDTRMVMHMHQAPDALPGDAPAAYDFSDLSRADSIYVAAAPDGSCGAKAAAGPDVLRISSVNRSSASAYALRDDVLPTAKRLRPPPRGLGVPRGVTPAARPDAAYRATSRAGTSVGLAELGTSTVLIEGDVTAAEVAAIVADLEAR